MVASSFLPKILGGGGDLQIVFLLENECIWNGVNNHKWWGHSTLLAGNINFESNVLVVFVYFLIDIRCTTLIRNL